jgi:hypothetical protein
MAENYRSGQGGHVKLTAAITRPVTEWKLKKGFVLADATTSASGTKKRKGIIPDSSFNFSTPWDLDQVPETVGLANGAEIADIRFFIGDSGLMYGPFSGIIEDMEIVVDATKDIVRLNITGYSQTPVGAPVPAA